MINKSNLLEIIAITNTLNVLYVEDEESVRFQTIKMLENYFTNIDVAVNGKDGLDSFDEYYIKNNKYYDLVITDIQMPEMNGISMIKEIYQKNDNQKVLVLSAYSDQKYFIELINLGIEGFIQKPLSFDQVTDAFGGLTKRLIDTSVISLACNCTYNILIKEFLYENNKINLTSNESKFIEFLINNKNNKVSIEEIFADVYYDDFDKEFSPDSIKGLIKRIRKKIPADLIQNDRGYGYSIKLSE